MTEGVSTGAPPPAYADSAAPVASAQYPSSQFANQPPVPASISLRPIPLADGPQQMQNVPMQQMQVGHPPQNLAALIDGIFYDLKINISHLNCSLFSHDNLI